MNTKNQNSGINLYSMMIFGIVIVVVLGTIISAIQIVPAGHRGILLEWGAVKDVLGEGLHFVMPVVNSVKIMDVRTQKYEIEADSASKDLQSIFSTVALNFHLDSGQVGVIYQTIGVDFKDKVIAPAIEEGVKAVTARFTGEESVTKREELKTMVKEELSDRLRPYNVVVETVSMVNFRYSDQFNRAIEDKVTAVQRALEAERKLEQIKFEAQQAREKAQGEADAILANARAEAESLKIKGDAIRKNPEVVELKALEAWDGALPVYMIGSGAVPFINIPTQ